MEKVTIMTDSNSGITQEEARENGIHVLAMPFEIDGQEYYEGLNLTQEQFYEKLLSGSRVSTSQPSPGSLTGAWDQLLTDCEEVVYIPMSSGLSGSCATAMLLAQEYSGRVHVVNNQRISVTMRQSVYDALELAREGSSGARIKDILEAHKFESSIYIMVDTLKYLRQGGRITPAAAALGTLLHLKPVLQIQGEKLDAYAKARTIRQAKHIMITAVRHDMEHRFGRKLSLNEVLISGAYTPGADHEEWIREAGQEFAGNSIYMQALPLSIACHIGPGALALTVTKKLM